MLKSNCVYVYMDIDDIWNQKFSDCLFSMSLLVIHWFSDPLEVAWTHRGDLRCMAHIFVMIDIDIDMQVFPIDNGIPLWHMKYTQQLYGGVRVVSLKFEVWLTSTLGIV